MPQLVATAIKGVMTFRKFSDGSVEQIIPPAVGDNAKKTYVVRYPPEEVRGFGGYLAALPFKTVPGRV